MCLDSIVLQIARINEENTELKIKNMELKAKIVELQNKIDKLEKDNIKLHEELDYMKNVLILRQFVCVFERRFLIDTFTWNSKWARDSFINVIDTFMDNNMNSDDIDKFRKGICEFFFENVPDDDEFIELCNNIRNMVSFVKDSGNPIAHPEKIHNSEIDILVKSLPDEFGDYRGMLFNAALWLDPKFDNAGLLIMPIKNSPNKYMKSNNMKKIYPH